MVLSQRFAKHPQTLSMHIKILGVPKQRLLLACTGLAAGDKGWMNHPLPIPNNLIYPDMATLYKVVLTRAAGWSEHMDRRVQKESTGGRGSRRGGFGMKRPRGGGTKAERPDPPERNLRARKQQIITLAELQELDDMSEERNWPSEPPAASNATAPLPQSAREPRSGRGGNGGGGGGGGGGGVQYVHMESRNGREMGAVAAAAAQQASPAKPPRIPDKALPPFSQARLHPSIPLCSFSISKHCIC